MAGLGEAHVQFDARDAERHLARAGVAEASRPQGDVGLVGLALDEAMVNRTPVPVEEVERHRAASSFGDGGSVNADEGRAG